MDVIKGTLDHAARRGRILERQGARPELVVVRIAAEDR